MIFLKKQKALQGVIALSLLLLLCVPLPISAKTVKQPTVSAQGAILMEAQSGAVLYAKEADTPRPMASTTKIMTAYVALTHGDPVQTVAVDPRAVGIEGSSVYLKAGELLSLKELLYAVLLSSANDAAAAVAYAIAGSIEAFADLMNAQADEWGLIQTHFENPHGLDAAGHQTTPRELALITRYALQNEVFAEIVSTYRHTMERQDGVRVLINHNRLLRTCEGVIGVKTGYTKRCGRCLVSAAERDGVRMIAVTLNDCDDWNDHELLFEYGFSQYENRCVVESQALRYTFPVIGGEKDSITVQNKDAVYATLPKGESDLRVVLEGQRFFFAPVATEEILLTAKIYQSDRLLGEVPLYATDSVKQKEVSKKRWYRFWS